MPFIWFLYQLQVALLKSACCIEILFQPLFRKSGKRKRPLEIVSAIYCWLATASEQQHIPIGFRKQCTITIAMLCILHAKSRINEFSIFLFARISTPPLLLFHHISSKAEIQSSSMCVWLLDKQCLPQQMNLIVLFCHRQAIHSMIPATEAPIKLNITFEVKFRTLLSKGQEIKNQHT